MTNRRTFLRKAFALSASGIFVPQILRAPPNLGFMGKKSAASNGLLTNLRAYWNLDESASPWVDSTGNAWTSTSSGGTGVSSTAILGAHSISVGGPFGTFVDMPIIDASWSGLTDGNSGIGSGTDFTVQFWIKSSAQGSGTFAPVLATINSSYNSGGFIVRSNNAGTGLEWDISTALGSSSVMGLTPTFSDNAWHHVVVGFDHTMFSHGGQWAMFDGANYQTLDPSGNGNTHGCLHNLALTLANYKDHPSNAWNGLIDEVALWIPRSLSQADVTKLYNSGAGYAFSNFTN